tara:strand:+ start:1352 stop:1705 length:354 start_codon:yes stop_codon:yes gene_type:complete
MNDIDVKKKQIYEKLHNSIVCDEIIDLIHQYNIPKTINNNGIFINISVLDDNYIQLLSEKIEQNDNKDDTEIRYVTNLENQKEYSSEISNPKKPSRVVRKKEKIPLTELQKKILSFS